MILFSSDRPPLPKTTNPKGDSRAFIKSGDIVIELTQLKEEGAGDPEGAINHIDFSVDDVEREIERLKELGVEFESPIKGQIPGLSFVL